MIYLRNIKFYRFPSGGDFVNIENAEDFLSSSDRQSILLHFLNSIRADKGDSVGEVTFREGEALGEEDIDAVDKNSFIMHLSSQVSEQRSVVASLPPP